MPIHVRGKAMIVPVIFELLGTAFMIYLSGIYLTDFNEGDWRSLIL